MTRLGLLAEISERVRFSRKRFGTYEVIDFVVVLMGYAISGEPTLAAYYQRLQPFAVPFMALFGRERLPHRSTLSRFLAALDQASVEALRSVFAARTRWLVRDPWRVWEVCGIGKGNDGWSSIWTARDKPHDSVRCPRVLISLRHSDACKRSVHLATRDASAERWFALARRSCRLIPISGWERLGMRAMRTTAGSCCEDWRWWWPISAHRASCLLDPRSTGWPVWRRSHCRGSEDGWGKPGRCVAKITDSLISHRSKRVSPCLPMSSLCIRRVGSAGTCLSVEHCL